MTSPWATDRATRARHARIIQDHLRKHLPMEQLKLPTVDLTVDVEAFIGLTDWKSAAVELPPTIGWWKTRKKSSPGLLQPQRRWFNGITFSYPVLVNVDCDEQAEEMAVCTTHHSITDIEWCGLKAPHPSGYSYNLIRTRRRL